MLTILYTKKFIREVLHGWSKMLFAIKLVSRLIKADFEKIWLRNNNLLYALLPMYINFPINVF